MYITFFSALTKSASLPQHERNEHSDSRGQEHRRGNGGRWIFGLGGGNDIIEGSKANVEMARHVTMGNNRVIRLENIIKANVSREVIAIKGKYVAPKCTSTSSPSI
jgi:hypothetical protein